MEKYVWQHMRRDEIAEMRDHGAVVIVPVGSIEQHGAHLPVDVDIFMAQTVALAAAQALSPEVPVLVAPSVWTGVSPHHMHFTGTLTLTVDTFSQVISEIVTCMWQHGFRHILLLNGHGGNDQTMKATTLKLGAAGIEVAAATYWDLAAAELAELVEGERKKVGHACEIETSLMLYLRQEFVDMSTAVKDLGNPPTRLPTGGAVYFWPVFDPGTTGVAGDPTLATAEKGKAFLDAITKNLAEFIRTYHKTHIP